MSKRRTSQPGRVGNPELVAALQGLRRSNAAGKHADRRDRRARTRAASRARAMGEW